MTSNKVALCTNYIFSLACRERCMVNMRNLRVPNGWQSAAPSAPNTAVLISLCSVEKRPALLYTIRSANLRPHCGQISFPSGKIGDNEDPIQAALKATHEEIGLLSTKVDVWGQGVPIPGSNQQVILTPVVGAIHDLKKEDVKMNVKEVSEVFAVPLELLCDPKNQFYTQFRDGYVLPVFVVEDYKIWGITAYITHTFLNCLLPREIYKNEWTKNKIDLKENDAPIESQ